MWLNVVCSVVGIVLGWAVGRQSAGAPVVPDAEELDRLLPLGDPPKHRGPLRGGLDPKDGR